ncbi:MAG: ester cyclase [Solirubrobacterales bacterium]|nr:ester cyclase [Solirubrobacterales bacterium]
MAPSDIARRYFDALSARDVDAAVACWATGAVDRMVGQQDLVAPEGVRQYLAELFGAFPDGHFEVLDLIAAGKRIAVRWRARGTFAGPGRFQGFEPNHATLDIEGCDVFTIAGDSIQGNDAYFDSASIARQLGMLPPVGSRAEARLTRLANARTRARGWIHGVELERIAEGVWIVRGGFPLKTMNVYLLEDDGGVTVFDAGISDMTAALRATCVRLGGIKRVVLGHADCDHRGAAPRLEAPVLCHPAEEQAAESAHAFRPYWDFSQLSAYARPIYPRLLRAWDGGAVKLTGTVQEGDEIAGFRVVHLPGHAPGLIGLFREPDRLALVSDCFYTVDPQTGRKNAAHVPHPAFNFDTDQARASIRKLAQLAPSAAWPGHADPVTGDVLAQLERAASAPA